MVRLAMVDPRTEVILAAVPRRLVAVSEARGASMSALLRGLSIDPAVLEDAEAFVPIAVLYELWERAIRSLDAPALPLWVAQAMRLEDLHVTGFAIATASTGREAFQRAMRYSNLLTNSASWRLEESGDLAEVRFDRDGPRPLGTRVDVECALASVVHAIRQVGRDDFAPLRIRFRHRASFDLGAHREHFDCPLDFGAEMDAIVMRRSQLDGTPRSMNPAMGAFFESYANSLLHRLEPDTSLARRVREAIMAELPSGGVSMHTVAKRMRTSERTLRRQLAAENVIFRDLVEDIRKRRAEQLLAERALTLTDIAFALGYSEASAFSRAYRRWTGCAPRQR
jgi:AraC-like DNA-binding protein